MLLVFVDKSGWYKISNKSKTTEFGAGADNEEEDKGCFVKEGGSLCRRLPSSLISVNFRSLTSNSSDSIEITGQIPRHFKFGEVL